MLEGSVGGEHQGVHGLQNSTELDLFQFTVTQLGLPGAPATFQRLMDHVLEGFEGCCAAYRDASIVTPGTIISRIWSSEGYMKQA